MMMAMHHNHMRHITNNPDQPTPLHLLLTNTMMHYMMHLTIGMRWAKARLRTSWESIAAP